MEPSHSIPVNPSAAGCAPSAADAARAADDSDARGPEQLAGRGRGCRRPAASHRWLVDIVARHGSAVDDSGLFHLPATQAALADEAGCSAGTIQARIRVLERHGLVVSRRPLTVRLVAPTTGTGSTGLSGAAGRGSLADSPSEVSEALPLLLAANASVAVALAAFPTAELLQAQEALIRAIGMAGTSRPANPVSNLADPRGCEPREPADPRVSLVVPRESVSQELSSFNENPSNSLTEGRGSATRSTAARGSSKSRIRGPVVTAAEQVDELTAPLVALADRCGLVGVTDRSGLHEALAPFTADGIRHAVSLVGRMTSAKQTHSPVGWLIAAARRGDPALFNPAAPAHNGARAGPGTAPPPDLVDVNAEEALTAATPDELDRIDAQIRSAPHNGPILQRIFSRPEALHAARLSAWRTLQETS